MLKNYFKTAWRNLLKNRTFSIINVLGLALGLSTSMLIILWVIDERSMDKFHAIDDQLYTIYERQYHDGLVNGGYSTPGMLSDEMRTVLPEVEYTASMAWNALATFEVNGKILKETGTYAGEDLFSMFSYPLIAGSPSDALRSPVDIAISRKMAEDFFGSASNALGQAIRYQDRKDLKVTAVFENINTHSTKQFNYVINWQTFLEENSWAKNWGNNGPSTFIALRKGTDLNAFRKKITHFLELYNKEENFRIELDMQAYSDQYLNSTFKDGEISGGRIQYVKLFSVIAVFILLIACINFMNLTTAKSFRRSKEIGIRKVAGAVRGMLIRQFIAEAVWIVTLSFGLALILVVLLLPVFNTIVQKQISIPLQDITFWSGLALLTILTGVFAGSYPAFYLSSFNPIRAIKGSLKFSQGSKMFRKGLVVFQFVLSMMLIIGTIVITGQVKFIQSAHLGYDKENLVYIPMEGALREKFELFKRDALRSTSIEMVSQISQSPTTLHNNTGGVVWDGKDPNVRLQFTQAAVGLDFVKTMKLQVVEGRDFSDRFATDSVAYIVNEAALKIINYKEPIGMPLTFWNKPGKIVGVVKDFHFTSLHSNINPLVLRLAQRYDGVVALVRVKPGNTQEALADLEKVCKDLNPQFPFTYQFSDQEYQKLYQNESVISILSNAFAGLAIFISCLGLLGLAIFTAEQRTKEIGIRKVLGASLGSLFTLLSRDIMLMVTVALLIASPLAWYFMDTWLSAYAYRIPLSWQMFVFAGSAAILIALITISFQTVKALLANPVTSLRAD